MHRASASLALTVLLTASCGDEPTAPTSADRTKFVGTWGGSYACPGGGSVADTLGIALGAGALDFSIIIHANAGNPDTVSGSLTEPNKIDLPAQSMGGVPGTTAQIISHGAVLTYNQAVSGFTCGGTNYAKVP